MKQIKLTSCILLTLFLSTTFAQDDGWYSQRNSSWKDVRLGSTAHTVSSCTIGNYGCAMTCGAMLCQIETGGDTSTVTPKNLNTWLISTGGYQYSEGYALLVWSKIAEMDGTGGLIYEGSNSGWNNWSYLDSELAAGRKVIVKVDFNINTAAIEGHWVVVMEKNGESGKPGSYKIYDPWPQDYTNRTLAYYYDPAFDNTFFASRSYSGQFNQQTGTADIRLNSQISVIPNPLIKDQSAEVRIGVINSGDATFSGEIAAAIHNNNGNFLADIERKYNFSLMANQTRTLSFQTDSMNVAAGNYQVQIKFKSDNGNWDLVQGYTNPVSIQIKEQITDDQYEENDSYETAYNLTSYKNSWIQGIQSDEDWYKIFVDEGAEHIQIDLSFTHDAGDIDLKLFDANNSNLQSSTSSDNNELIEYTVPNGNAWYYIKVYYDNAGNDYRLMWKSMALPTGALQVSIQPVDAVNDGAKWRVDSGLWHESRFIENGLSTGQHTIEFKSISGWQKPNNR
ncbi:secreted protein containing Peptidase, archaeal and bacterial, partial [Candidatus Magnetomorum sp. HK-1]